MPKKQSNLSSPIEVLGHPDPEVLAMQAMITGIRHFDERNLGAWHLKVLMAAELAKRIGKQPPRLVDIATFARQKEAAIQPFVRDLVERRYLVEVMPKFGNLIYRYKLGPSGGTLLRNMMKDNAF